MDGKQAPPKAGKDTTRQGLLLATQHARLQNGPVHKQPAQQAILLLRRPEPGLQLGGLVNQLEH